MLTNIKIVSVLLLPCLAIAVGIYLLIQGIGQFKRKEKEEREDKDYIYLVIKIVIAAVLFILFVPNLTEFIVQKVQQL